MTVYIAMIFVCPHCGNRMPDRLVDGLACCTKCSRIIDSSLHNRLLSASWLIRQNNYHGIDQLISDTKMPEHEAILVYTFIAEQCYTHEDFQKVLRLFGIAGAKTYIDPAA